MDEAWIWLSEQAYILLPLYQDSSAESGVVKAKIGHPGSWMTLRRAQGLTKEERER